MPFSSRQALEWDGPAIDLVRGLKDRGIRAAAEPCADAIVEFTPPVGCALVPVPPSARGSRDRGFDQALLLARLCGEAWGVEVAPALERIRPGRQRGASLRARRALTRDAFRVRSTVEPREAVLIDDVVTTGSTLAAAAGALRASGWRVRSTRAVTRVIVASRRG